MYQIKSLGNPSFYTVSDEDSVFLCETIYALCFVEGNEKATSTNFFDFMCYKALKPEPFFDSLKWHNVIVSLYTSYNEQENYETVKQLKLVTSAEELDFVLDRLVKKNRKQSADFSRMVMEYVSGQRTSLR